MCATLHLARALFSSCAVDRALGRPGNLKPKPYSQLFWVMGLPSTSRKGKKAWRKNIDASEVVEAVQKETHQERRGPAVETLKDDELFFEDKGAPQATIPQNKAKAKRQARPTRAQLILAAPQGIAPVVKHVTKKKDGGLRLPRQLQLQQHKQQGQQQLAAVHPPKQQEPGLADLDLWEVSEDPDLIPSTSNDRIKILQPVGPTTRVGRHRSKPLPAPRIKAVEVDMQGCSYNPEHESHQDALAVLVATENKKLLKKELAPKPVPLHVDDGKGQQLDELEMLLTDAPADDAEVPLTEDTEGDDAESDGDGKGDKSVNGNKVTKKTKKDRNRAARAAAEARAAEARHKLKQQRRELHNLTELAEQVEEEEQLKAAKRLRRQVVQEEKAMSQPPRLGKLKFEDLSVQVLTSDELGGSLRRLKAFPMLATERFKSLQKRGLIEPRRPVGERGSKKVIVYEKNARREKATAGQEELDALKTANKKKAKALKAAV